MSDPAAPPPDNAALVARCLAGEEAAWSLLVNRHQRLVWAVARRIGLDEHGAADVFQTVFARLLEHLPRIEQPERLQAWIVTTAKREALRQRARGQREVSLTPAEGGEDQPMQESVPEPADPQLPLDEALSQLQQLDRVHGALERMDERCRALIALLYEGDQAVSYDDIAARLGMPVGSIGPTRARCLGKLRQLLA